MGAGEGGAKCLFFEHLRQMPSGQGLRPALGRLSIELRTVPGDGWR
jgi:hypothetical protein